MCVSILTKIYATADKAQRWRGGQKQLKMAHTDITTGRLPRTGARSQFTFKYVESSGGAMTLFCGGEQENNFYPMKQIYSILH